MESHHEAAGKALHSSVATLALSLPPTAWATFASSIRGDRLILTRTVDSGANTLTDKLILPKPFKAKFKNLP